MVKAEGHGEWSHFTDDDCTRMYWARSWNV